MPLLHIDSHISGDQVVGTITVTGRAYTTSLTEGYGSPSVTMGSTPVVPVSIDSGEAWGFATVQRIFNLLTVELNSIETGESWGEPIAFTTETAQVPAEIITRHMGVVGIVTRHFPGTEVVTRHTEDKTDIRVEPGEEWRF